MFFFFNDPATTEIYTLSLHDALPISLPILVPLADLRGLSRQVTVRAYQYGGGLCELFTPTNGALLAILAAAQVRYEDWLRFALPLLLTLFFLSSRRRHTRFDCDWSYVCSSDLRAFARCAKHSWTRNWRLNKSITSMHTPARLSSMTALRRRRSNKCLANMPSESLSAERKVITHIRWALPAPSRRPFAHLRWTENGFRRRSTMEIPILH